MSRTRHSRSPKGRGRHHVPGEPPGTLYDGGLDAGPLEVVVREYSGEHFQEARLEDLGRLEEKRDSSLCYWVDVTGLPDPGSLSTIGKAFGLHELSLEDVLDPRQRAKVEHYDDYTFVVARTLTWTGNVEFHQLSVFFGEGFVVTFQEPGEQALNPVRERLRSARGKIRTRSADYLAYALIDSVIDLYFPVVEALDDQIAQVEDAVFEARSVNPLELTRQARFAAQTARHVVWSARDTIAALISDDSVFVGDETRVHLRDCYDHLIQLQDTLEVSREIASSLFDAYISRVSLRTNEVMKFLTIIATIFIPMTFITSLYGMNFNTHRSPFNMPELNWYFGYPFALALMLSSTVLPLLYFKRRGWFLERR